MRLWGAAMAAVLSILAADTGVSHAQLALGDWFARRDANGDGFLTREEWTEAREQRLRLIDENGDGGITRAEFLAFERRRAAARVARLFGRIDTDGDGVITRAERDAILDRRFARIDADNDGRVSRDELTQARSRFKADTPGD